MSKHDADVQDTLTRGDNVSSHWIMLSWQRIVGIMTNNDETIQLYFNCTKP